jgi:sortase A
MRRLATLLAVIAALALPALSAGSSGAAAPRLGERLGTIVIPRLHLNAPMREGTDASELNLGPGHFAWTDLPGQGGTVAIAAHRTTYGAWFRQLDELIPGDTIEVTIVPRFGGGSFHYVVTGHRIVPWNSDRTLVRDKGFERLILSACHPPGSAAFRYVVFAYPVRR